ncbi:uncharacterized protein (DUF58 family) [Aquibacillus albus]|uniref:Uncharacterized protein (DUF58 family) n=2 Tax=Aquibacillus albus TaxID=1168171 RepID=A0ABS2N761_9BACI|nr:uncharacterized protein (DUF58 family) [Aquibacillus albus]
MLQAIKQLMPKDQGPLVCGVIIVWVSSLLYLLFSGGKLAFILFVIITMISTYQLLLAKCSGIHTITGDRISKLPKRLEAGDFYHIKTTFRIPGFWPILYVLIKERLTHHKFGTQIYESSFVPNFYRCGDIAYSIPNLKRGSYTFEETECSTGDLLNLFEHKSSLQLPLSFNVYPRTVHIDNWPYVSSFRKAIRQTSASKYQKETIEMDGIRDYVHGDRLSIIHWNASAKTGDLKAKEFIRESVPNILILIDQYYASYHDEEQFELAVSTAASIIRYIRNHQIPVGLFLPGKQIRFYEPRPGVTYSHRLEEHLLHVDKNGEIPIEEVLLNQKLKQLQGSLVIVITPEASDSLFQRLQGLKKIQLHPCHIFLSSKDMPETELWENQLKKERIRYYPVRSLEALPAVLGGD